MARLTSRLISPTPFPSPRSPVLSRLSCPRAQTQTQIRTSLDASWPLPLLFLLRATTPQELPELSLWLCPRGDVDAYSGQAELGCDLALQ